jgi:hypothetical protein
MPKIIDLTGQKFGRLTAVRLVATPEHINPITRSKFWAARCECGTEIVVVGNNLRNGNTKSCGCWKRDNGTIQGTKYGMYSLPERKIWQAAIERCENPNNKGYPRYGARGVKMFEGWRNDFQAFYEYVGPRPSPKHSLDRINVNGNYEPGNVRWATIKEQQRNKRNTVFLEHNGRRMSLNDWAEETGIARSCLYYRITQAGQEFRASPLTKPLREWPSGYRPGQRPSRPK